VGGILFGLPAVILGWIARSQISSQPDKQGGSELATIGLVMGLAELTLSLLLLCLVVAGVGVPSILGLLTTTGRY
jgi:hypothetical protein